MGERAQVPPVAIGEAHFPQEYGGEAEPRPTDDADRPWPGRWAARACTERQSSDPGRQERHGQQDRRLAGVRHPALTGVPEQDKEACERGDEQQRPADAVLVRPRGAERGRDRQGDEQPEDLDRLDQAHRAVGQGEDLEAEPGHVGQHPGEPERVVEQMRQQPGVDLTVAVTWRVAARNWTALAVPNAAAAPREAATAMPSVMPSPPHVEGRCAWM